MFLLVGGIRCHSKAATWKDRAPEPGQSPGAALAVSHLKSQPCCRGKGIVSAGECRTIGQHLADFVQILDETPSVRFLMIQDTIYYTWKPGQVKDLHLGPESKTCFLMGKIRYGHMTS